MLRLPEKLIRDKDLLLPASLFLVTVISRIPFTSKYLYHMDSVQFALALDQYDVTVHQPHPPGYFLYVMLGRLLNILMSDANTVFVTISIVFSGLTVVAIYYLGKELFEKRTGLLAALIAITSPTIWFHGEVGLTYIVEAFFSIITAFFCWKVYKGNDRYIWCSALVLGLAGGIRQNTLIFLLPLWLFCVIGVRLHKVIVSFGVICVTTLLWFIPMISMTGGLDAYTGALRELWLFNTGNNTVFEQGWPVFKYYSSTLFDFTFYGLGAGLLIIGLAVYSIVRNEKMNSLDRSRILFFAFWILPSIAFYLLIFIHPANPGYALIYLPGLIVLAAASVSHMANEFRIPVGSAFPIIMISSLLVINTCIFFFSNYPISYRKMKDNGRNLQVVLSNLKSLDPSDTAIFTGPYIYWGYRQIMYYLPDYVVYQMDYKKAPSGEIRKTFWGINKKTFVTSSICMPKKIKNFAVLLTTEDRKRIDGIQGIRIREISTDMCIASGEVRTLQHVYPQIKSFASM